MWQKCDDEGHKYKSFRAWYTNVTRWLTPNWDSDCESTGIYLVWVQVPTRCECRYLPGVSAGTCTYPVRVLVPTRCEYRYLPVVIRAASDQFGGDVATAVQHWQAVHNKQLTLLYTKQPVHNKQLTLLNTKATCTQETANPFIQKTTCKTPPNLTWTEQIFFNPNGHNTKYCSLKNLALTLLDTMNVMHCSVLC